MAFVLQAWCLYCLISAGTSLLIFIVTQLLAHLTRHDYASLKLWLYTLFAWKYQHILKPLFFLLDAEFVHTSMVTLGEWLGKSAIGRHFIALCFGYSNPVLSKTIDGIVFPGPLGLAAGFDYNGQLTQILPSLGFGFHTIGTVTLLPYQGNTGTRLDRLPSSRGLLINKGLKSLGAVAVARALERLPLHIPTGISIASTNQCYDTLKDQLLDIAQSFTIFEKSSVQHAYYEMNISCPNTFGGEPFTTPDRLEILLTMLDRLQISKPLYIKMPIDQSENETLQLAKVAAKHTIAGLIFGNLTKNKNNPAITPADRLKWSNQAGNVSGKPTWERSNTLLELIKKHYGKRFTLIGTGGIFSPQDFAKKQELGADLAQLITGMIFQGPQLIGQINAWLTLRKNTK
jgi:dihydroorotate dehydrogenase